jgi:peptidylprolyl isomerase
LEGGILKKINTLFFIAIILVILGVILMSGCLSDKTAQEGDTVTVSYKGTLDNGTVFEQNITGYTFVLGQHEVAGFENAIYGMSIGEKKEVRISPNEAYGPHKPEEVKSFEKHLLESVYGDIAIGQEVLLDSGSEEPYRGFIADIKSDTVVVDFNHPLSGQYLNYEIRVFNIK